MLVQLKNQVIATIDHRDGYKELTFYTDLGIKKMKLAKNVEVTVNTLESLSNTL